MPSVQGPRDESPEDSRSDQRQTSSRPWSAALCSGACPLSLMVSKPTRAPSRSHSSRARRPAAPRVLLAAPSMRTALCATVQPYAFSRDASAPRACSQTARSRCPCQTASMSGVSLPRAPLAARPSVAPLVVPLSPSMSQPARQRANARLRAGRCAQRSAARHAHRAGGEWRDRSAESRRANARRRGARCPPPKAARRTPPWRSRASGRAARLPSRGSEGAQSAEVTVARGFERGRERARQWRLLWHSGRARPPLRARATEACRGAPRTALPRRCHHSDAPAARGPRQSTRRSPRSARGPRPHARAARARRERECACARVAARGDPHVCDYAAATVRDNRESERALVRELRHNTAARLGVLVGCKATARREAAAHRAVQSDHRGEGFAHDEARAARTTLARRACLTREAASDGGESASNTASSTAWRNTSLIVPVSALDLNCRSMSPEPAGAPVQWDRMQHVGQGAIDSRPNLTRRPLVLGVPPGYTAHMNKSTNGRAHVADFAGFSLQLVCERFSRTIHLERAPAPSSFGREASRRRDTRGLLRRTFDWR